MPPFKMKAAVTAEHVPAVRGIYRIVCLPMRKAYVGQTVSFAKRWLEHQVLLRDRRHPNRALQAAFNHYGPAAFTFEVLEFIHGRDRDELSLAEQRWMDRHPEKFNVRPAGDDNFIAWRKSKAAKAEARKAERGRDAQRSDTAADNVNSAADQAADV